jgi:hypothetical protein
MSYTEAPSPVSSACESTPAIDTIIEPRPRDIGGFSVRRVLPSPRRRMVGPFIFFDQMGPAELAPGAGLDVRPHPHINLATVTYLFEGEIEHRDSLGSHQAIQPGAINWMTAGSGIVHSERTPEALRLSGHRLHGIQLWVALPTSHEETAPEFFHHPASTLPRLEAEGVELRVLAGEAFGAVAPVRIFSPLFYVDARLESGATLELPSHYTERAAYVVSGTLVSGREQVLEPKLLVFRAGLRAVLRATSPARVMLFGGEPLDGARHIYWNFVSNSTDRIERAKRDWQEGRFPLVPGDEYERIPLPEP